MGYTSKGHCRASRMDRNRAKAGHVGFVENDGVLLSCPSLA